ncbi:MAG: hypothetical protein HRU70_00325 [Phycisphaeraceae bacterium]|nr:MAG: hypothetical protein HRU70_00325 [Phycisphaeraceae bacterium]
MFNPNRALGLPLREALWIALPTAGLVIATVSSGDPLTTPQDFFTPGTQPLEYTDYYETALVCQFCHGGYDINHEPYRNWNASMHGQAARDPVFHAAMAIAAQDAPGSTESCIRCHAPRAHVSGRNTGSLDSLEEFDFEGVSCIMCHRTVDPVYKPGISPGVDEGILASLLHPPVSEHNTAMVFDPEDRRRGPFDVPPNAEYHPWLRSPYHQTSNMCANCHEVSNPAFTRQPDGTYALNDFNTPHPTQNKYDMFPEQRTWSEWSQSAFAQAPIDMGGRFGGNKREVSTCQDCHMPDTTGTGCAPFLGGPVRHDLPNHHFSGANTWVLRAIDKLYPRYETDLSDETINNSIDRAVAMLEAASDMELSVVAGQLNVRVINQTGHKLPTGYPEGRRIWVNVAFYNAAGDLIREHGAYDEEEAFLDEYSTKVYEGKIGLDESVAALSGIPSGFGFHLALSNTWFKDNRIPPRGFNNANFALVQAAPVAYTYADGQYWDDTRFDIPSGTARVRARVFHQLTTRDYIEFLRSENRTNNAGEVLYTEWLRWGKSPPTLMDDAELTFCTADFNGDEFLDFFDLDAFVACFEGVECPPGKDADYNADGFVDFFDLDAFIADFEAGC